MIKTAFTYKGLKIEYMRSRKTSKTIITVLILFLLSACAGSDSKKYDGKLKIEDGMAMPMTLYSDPSADNANSNILRYCVYVETDHDTDGDGKADLVKVLIQLPKSAAEGKYKAAAIYDPTPSRSRKDDANMGVSLNKKDEVYSFKIDNASVEVLLPIR